MTTQTPWWVSYVFIGALVLAAFIFTMQSRMTPAEFLAFAAALGFRAPQSPQANVGVQNVEGDVKA